MKDLFEALATARASVAMEIEKRAPHHMSLTLFQLDSLLAIAVRLAYEAQKEGTP